MSTDKAASQPELTTPRENLVLLASMVELDQLPFIMNLHEETVSTFKGSYVERGGDWAEAAKATFEIWRERAPQFDAWREATGAQIAELYPALLFRWRRLPEPESAELREDGLEDWNSSPEDPRDRRPRAPEAVIRIDDTFGSYVAFLTEHIVARDQPWMHVRNIPTRGR